MYGCLILPLLASWMRIRLTPSGKMFLLLWGTYIAVAAVQALIWNDLTPWLPGHLLGGADNLLRPVAVFLLATVWMVTTVDRERLLRVACKITVGAMCLNSVLALIESQVDISQWLSPFWTSLTDDVLGGTVAGRASQLGRFTGLLNQPAEAGSLYAIALFAALYLWHRKPWRLTATLVLLTVGGVFTVSKIFLLGALPIALWQVLRLRGRRLMRLGLVAFALTIAYTALSAGLLPGWPGSDLMLRYLRPTNNYLLFFSAGRYGGATFLTELVSTVLSRSPLAGFGLRGLVAAYDSGWVQALVFAGIIGVAMYTGVLLVLIRAWWTRRQYLAPAESTFAASLVLLAIGASFGFPALTGNRVATVLWVLLSLTLLVRDPSAAEPRTTVRPRGRGLAAPTL